MFTFRPANRKSARSKQRGAAMMVMLVIMVMGTAAFLVSALSSSSVQIERNQNSSQILSKAKDAVLGNIITGTGGQIPGNTLRPDSFASTESPYNYDGAADSGCFDASKNSSTPIPGLPLISSGTNMRCLGRLPWKDYGISMSSNSENDPTGIMPWYGVSANLVDPTNVIFNPGLLNANPLHPWLTVRDMNGNVISNRVAIVLIVAGVGLQQSRTSAPNLAGPNQYLDSITVPVGCATPCILGTYNNYDLDDDYIMGEEHRWIADPLNPGKLIDDPTYKFNDKLLYITIDDLMPLVVKRIAGEARLVLKDFRNVRAYFPDAASLGSSGTASSGNSAGMLPIKLGSCSCTNSTICSCNFDLVASIAFRRGGSSTWSAANDSGACTTTSSQVCTCTGAGSCENSSETRNFTCASNGSCTHNTTSGIYIFTPPSYAVFSSATNNCNPNSGTVQCGDTGSFDSNLKLPSWFTDNLWQNFFYYRRSSGGNLQVGTQNNIQALLVGTGAPVLNAPYASKGSAQTPPSNSIGDYLDSLENTNGDLVFDVPNKPLSNSYNDQTFIAWP